MNKQHLPSYTSVLYYIILALAITGIGWSYLMPVEITVPGIGYVSFLGEPQAICAFEDGVVESISMKSIGEVKVRQSILAYEKLIQGTAANEKRELLAPCEGTIIWQRELIKGDMLRAGERIGLIYPSYPIGVKVYLKEQDLSRVQPKMPVRIRLDAYPFQNFGMLNGTVKELITQNSSVPGREMEVVALIEVEKTDDKNIILRPGLTADVEIIIGKTKLLNKLLF
jgi:hypothetical protein